MLPEKCENCDLPFNPVPKQQGGKWTLCCNDCQHETEPSSVGPYKIFLFLGAGAFSEVYLARLENSEWAFALKLLTPTLISDQEAKRRFLREVHTASQLHHPNICTIFNHGKNTNAPPSQAKYNDAPFIVMEYIAGKTLRARLDELIERHQKPEFEEWLDIAIQIAEGLCAAHKKDVIHRDIKPENIMINAKGEVKILDFGLAKRSYNPDRPISSSAPTESIPQAGQRFGTYAYMSPEQMRGDPSVDARSDVFSFGVVLYEIFSGGVNPFNKGTQSAIYIAITTEEPPPLSQFNNSLLDGLQAIVNKALHKDRDCRYQKTEELLKALKDMRPESQQQKQREIGEAQARKRQARMRHYLIIIVLLVLLAIAVAVVFTLVKQKGPKKDNLESIVVIPLANQSADLNIRYTCNEMTDSLIGILSRIPELRVISRDAAFSYENKKVDPRKVGQELGVNVVLTGTISDRDNRLVIHIYLDRVSDGSQLLNQEYDRERSDLIATQKVINDICTDVVTTLTGKRQSFPRQHYIIDTQAYDLYSKGLLFLRKRNVADLNRSIDFFRESVQNDPQNALAYVGIADAYILLGSQGYSAMPPKEALPQARKAAQKALEIEPTSSEAITSLALIRMLLDWDWTGAETEFKRAIELNPNYATAHHWYANYLVAMRRFNEAETEIKTAQQIDPFSLIIRATVGWISYFEGHYDDAIKRSSEIVQIQKDFYPAHAFLGFAYEQNNQLNKALQEFQTAKVIANDNPVMIAEIARLQAKLGNYDIAEQALGKLQELTKKRYIPSDNIAMIYAELDDTEQAFAWLEKAFNDHATGLVQLNVEPKFNSLRSDPRFISLMQRMDLIK